MYYDKSFDRINLKLNLPIPKYFVIGNNYDQLGFHDELRLRLKRLTRYFITDRFTFNVKSLKYTS